MDLASFGFCEMALGSLDDRAVHPVAMGERGGGGEKQGRNDGGNDETRNEKRAAFSFQVFPPQRKIL